MSVWAWILALGAGTFAIRASFLVPRGGGKPSPYIARVLRLVPAAVLSALAMPALFYVDGSFAPTPENEKLVAGVVAALVAWRTRNVALTLVVGMAVLWAIRVLR